MKLLPILYWIILILAVLGLFAPPTWSYAGRINNGAWVVLFIIIGLQIFKMAL